MSVIYLAARFERQDELRAYAAALRASGHTVTSRWLDAPGLQLGCGTEASWAALDIEDITRAGLFVLFTDHEMGRGGKDFETGLALATGCAVRLVGPRVHVFHWLPSIVQCETVAEFLNAMGAPPP